jgi:hypothetical protein
MLKNFCILFFIKIKYLILKHTRFQKNKNKYEKFKKLDKDKIISSININGFCIIDNYFDEKECDQIINEINVFIARCPDLVWNKMNLSDQRIFGFNNVSGLVDKFFKSIEILEIANAYISCRMESIFTIAAKINFQQGNLGSGGNWHRDSVNPSLKSMVYLVDVDLKNGPFEIVTKSNSFFEIINDSKKMNISNIKDTRFNDPQVNKIENFSNRKKTLKAKKGSLIIFDGSFIHRGRPLSEKNRYAITNYYYPVGKMTQEKYPTRPQVFKR